MQAATLHPINRASWEAASMVQAPAEETLEQLALRAQGGCLESYGRIVEALQDRLFTFLLQILGNPEDAEDAAQETFVKAHRALHSYDGRARVSTWIYTIGKNTALNEIRRRRPHEPLADHEPRLESKRPVSQGGADIWVIAKMLKPKLFELLWLHYAEGFSMEEMARITGGTSLSVRVSLHRARGELRKRCEMLKFQPELNC